MIELNKIYNEECLQGMRRIPDRSVDAIICDLPYGTTDCAWDSVIPAKDLWTEYKRIIKPLGNILLFGQAPFSESLATSNPRWFRYRMVWVKDRAAGHLMAKKRPMRKYEDILYFCQPFRDFYDTTEYFAELKDYFISEKNKTGLTGPELRALLGTCMASHYFTRASQFIIPSAEAYERLQSTGCFPLPYEAVMAMYKAETIKLPTSTYNPQNLKKVPPKLRGGGKRKKFSVYATEGHPYVQEYVNWPTDVLEYKHDSKRGHPTQKPVGLLEYLVKTYTNEGETVLDNCMGSGTTAVACINTGRNFIGFEMDKQYYEMANKRIEAAIADKQTRLF